MLLERLLQYTVLPIIALLAHVLPLHVIYSKTSKEDLTFVFPDIFNVPTTLELLFSNGLPNTFNAPLLVVIFNVVVPDTFDDDDNIVVFLNHQF